MRVVLILGCAATVLGGVAFAAHFETRQRVQRDAEVVRYAYRPAPADGNLAQSYFVVPARRQGFLGEKAPDEACELHIPAKSARRDERWKACMSRITGQQVSR
jgi:hypothetical protein